MGDISGSRVTITLGRSGQVVKRAGHAAEDGSFYNSQPSVGSKRSVRDRLGSIVDSTTQFQNKRQRGDGSRLSLSASNDVDDVHLTKNDLRFKIMRKTILNRSQNNSQQSGLDLRDILSRPAQSSTTSLGTKQHISHPKDTRKHFLEPRDSRNDLQETRNSRQLMPDPRDVRRHLTEPRDYRLQPPEPRDDRHILPELKDVRHLRLGTNSSSLPGKMLSSRSTDAFPEMESLRSSYSPWTLDSLRQRPSDRFPGTSRGVSPPRRNEEQERRPLVRAYDDSRVASYTSREAFERSRPMSSASHLAKTAQTAGPAKTMAPLPAPLPPSVSLVQKSSYTVDDQPTVDGFLHSLGLDKYSINFKAEEVDMYALKQMGDTDLKELGVPMGPRKKIMLALLSRAKRQI